MMSQNMWQTLMLRNLKIGEFADCCKWQQIFHDFGSDVCSSLLLADQVAVQAIFLQK